MQTRVQSRCSVRASRPACCPRLGACMRLPVLVRATVDTKEKEQPEQKTEAQQTTEKMGLEAGLFKVFTSKDESGKPSRTEQAKQLLTQYGSAYLITSISFAIVSFAICFAAVSAGVDVAALVSKLGLDVNTTNESVGTFALAYAAHKALSPVRFPPTVALTPVVAKWIGRKKEE
mmetsp:Transcript_1321/g.2115  ORF Transcript_1321/g.2115 Transcript_1321/m.2115 type:complete len:175 (-) Transcript_1321:39-563(-)